MTTSRSPKSSISKATKKPRTNLKLGNSECSRNRETKAVYNEFVKLKVFTERL